jgi:hypothetical protein
MSVVTEGVHLQEAWAPEITGHRQNLQSGRVLHFYGTNWLISGTLLSVSMG